jgi:hypothetical protein
VKRTLSKTLETFLWKLVSQVNRKEKGRFESEKGHGKSLRKKERKRREERRERERRKGSPLQSH